MAIIDIQNLKKYYGKSCGVEDVTLQVNEGEIYGFIGENGSGKSTTIRVLLNLNFPTSGSVRMLDMDCTKESKKIKEFVSYVPSEVVYYPTMKVRDLLKFALKLSPNGSIEDIERLCNYFDLEQFRLIKDLSLGNRKKVSIIQALIKKPKILILDEPTSGLDPLMQDKLFEVLLKEKASGMTIFLSSHNLSEVEKYCDRVSIIKSGKIVFEKELERRDNPIESRRTELEETFMQYYGGTNDEK